jgi:hypothetical protein
VAAPGAIQRRSGPQLPRGLKTCSQAQGEARVTTHSNGLAPSAFRPLLFASSKQALLTWASGEGPSQLLRVALHGLLSQSKVSSFLLSRLHALLFGRGFDCLPACDHGSFLRVGQEAKPG